MLERLTKENHTYSDCEFMDDGMSSYMNCLSAYENTGLEPEEIVEIKKREKIFYDVLKRWTDLGDYYHIRDLLDAERNGRLVVLPVCGECGDPNPDFCVTCNRVRVEAIKEKLKLKKGCEL